MIISIDSEKTFDKIQHLLIVLKKVGIEGTNLRIIKAVYVVSSQMNIILNVEKLKAF